LICAPREDARQLAYDSRASRDGAVIGVICAVRARTPRAALHAHAQPLACLLRKARAAFSIRWRAPTGARKQLLFRASTLRGGGVNGARKKIGLFVARTPEQ
jgi:hypothetical protein